MYCGCFLGLDGGGTKTHALALDAQGRIIGEATAGPCNIAAVAPAEALLAACAAADGALAQAALTRGDVRAICAGVAGYSQAERRALFTEGLQAAFPAADLQVAPDYAAALWGATLDRPGIVVIAGTGSVAFGENTRGETHRAGAYGYLVDDGGSGYGVGRAALAAVLRAADGTGASTALTERLLAATGLLGATELVAAVYGGPLDRVGIAALAPLVAASAHDDADPVARAILMRAGGALAKLTEAVAARLFPENETFFPVAAVGSLWQADAALTDVFDRSLARFAPHATRVTPKFPPAHGAALRAMNSKRVQDL
jgi:N-acetylglucosamine kinase-like BadF-type ATPase